MRVMALTTRAPQVLIACVRNPEPLRLSVSSQVEAATTSITRTEASSMMRASSVFSLARDRRLSAGRPFKTGVGSRSDDTLARLGRRDKAGKPRAHGPECLPAKGIGRLFLLPSSNDQESAGEQGKCIHSR